MTIKPVVRKHFSLSADELQNIKVKRNKSNKVSDKNKRKAQQVDNFPPKQEQPPTNNVKPKDVLDEDIPASPTPKPSQSRSLAERYVAQYEAQAGRILTDEQRSSKIKEVEQFYQSRSNRLDQIVFE